MQKCSIPDQQIIMMGKEQLGGRENETKRSVTKLLILIYVGIVEDHYLIIMFLS